jgi:dihydroorotate dehydrogenase (NAD+) catalytic subunit
MFSFEAERSAAVVAAARDAVSIPVGAKLSPNTPDLVGVASAVHDAGADFVVLTNTAFGFGIDIEERKPLLSGGVGGYSGPGLKPISLRCVFEVARALPGFPIVGCGGVSSGRDIVEYLMAGASAVAAGTVHLAEPKAGARITRELQSELVRLGFAAAADAVGAVNEW